MRRRHRRLVHPQRQARQLNLFAPLSPASCDRSAPEWRMLPEETRRAATGLMARLILEHRRVDHRLARMEAADDV